LRALVSVEGSPTFPPLYGAADAASGTGRRRFRNATGLRLLAAVLAAAASTVSGLVLRGRVEVFGVVAAVFFLVALGLEVWLLADRPEQSWYDRRALAESVKTLSWRYAVGGLPFSLAEDRANARLRDEIDALLDDADDDLTLPPTSVDVVTSWMAELRAGDLGTRRERYIKERVLDQQGWYATKSKYNSRRARAWKVALVWIEIGGAALALVKAFGFLEIDIASITSAAIGAGAAWLGAEQHELLGRSYAGASRELAIVASRLSDVDDEDAWAREVASAEAAVSREHVMWRAARAASTGSRLKTHHRTR